MRTWTTNILAVKGAKWLRTMVIPLAILLVGLAGGLSSWLMQRFVGMEMLALLGLLGLGSILLFGTLKYDLVVLLTFCLLGFVRMEPAPVDALAITLLVIGLLIGRLSLRTLKGSSAIHLTLGLFVVINLISLLATSAFFDGLRYTMITFYLIALAYLIRMYVISFQTMRNVIVGYLSGAILSVFMVALGYLGLGPPELFIEQSRAVALFKDANVFGPFLIPMIVLLVDESWHPCFFPQHFALKVLGIAALTAAVFLSFSRAAWGNLVLSLAIYLFLNRKELSARNIAALVLLSVVGLLALVITVNTLDLGGFLRWRATSFQTYDSVRFARQAAGVEAGLTHPFGIGPGQLFHAHSLYARTFGEYGISGFVLLFACLSIVFACVSLRAMRETSKPYGLSPRVMSACFAGLLMNSLVIDTVHWRHFWVVFALSWTIASAGNSPATSDCRAGSRAPGSHL